VSKKYKTASLAVSVEIGTNDKVGGHADRTIKTLNSLLPTEMRL